MNTRHLLRVASITSVAFLADGKADRVDQREQRKAAAQPRRWEAKARSSSRTPVSDRFRFAA